MRKPLPSWTEGGVGDDILRFVRRVSNVAHPGYVPPADRIAVFDSDGTLWCEQPASAQACFVMHRVRSAAGQANSVPSPALDAARAEDYAYFRALDLERLSEIVLQLNEGLTPEQFAAQARAFLNGALHPRFGVPFGQLTYRPMLELLALLEAKQFRAFIVTGGGVEFVRAASEALYGVPRERVAGATVDYALEHLDGKLRVIRTRHLQGDPGEGEAKVRAIQQRIGRTPILAIGNSAGDREMLEYTAANAYPSLCLWLQHDDPLREYVDPEPVARDGWKLISMQRDFRYVFTSRDMPRRAPGGVNETRLSRLMPRVRVDTDDPTSPPAAPEKHAV